MMEALNYFMTVSSLKRFTYRYVSSLAKWDCRSSF